MTIYDQDFATEEMLQAKYTGVTEPVAEDQAVQEETSEASVDHSPGAAEMVEDGHDKEYNFRALRESIAQEKAERELERRRHEQELERMQYQIEQMSRSTNESQISRKSALDGLEGSDLMTVEAYKKAQEEQYGRYQEEITALRYENLENRARLQHSDYNEVMEKYSIPLLRSNRDFARAFQAAENPAEFAYQLGRMQQNTQAPQPMVQNQAQDNAERIVSNARKPGTLSSARGGQASLSKADYYASMSDAEFAEMVQKNLAET